ncbi:hypothetical protein HYU22_01975 [Candidatus Woesearchaeota archaeon]|nr:hypothetical protein [Candidatus Woesearchaeota archaeon]
MATGKTLATLSLMGLLTSCGNSRLSEPKRAVFDRQSASVIMPLGSGPYYLFSRAYVRDLNGDGQADLIGSVGEAYYVAPEFVPTLDKVNKGRARVMTPEIRDAATRLVQANSDLGYLLAVDRYRVQQRQGYESR